MKKKLIIKTKTEISKSYYSFIVIAAYMYSSYLGIYAARNEDLMVKIGILGAGSWGLGLAMLLNNNGHEVTVWSVFPDEIKELDETRENKRCLPGVIFPEHIKFNADTEYVVKNSDVLILVCCLSLHPFYS